MWTIAGGILLAYGLVVAIVVGGGLIIGVLALPVAFARLAWLGNRKKPLPVQHFYEELPDHLAGSDNY